MAKRKIPEKIAEKAPLTPRDGDEAVEVMEPSMQGWHYQRRKRAS
ncbi:MAG: hypothetical protein Q7T86_04905 [Hyphomicrobiaceae bacterium]|nr:hypothetical protein [Hyphomicrobiaceae bacterium]